MKKALFLFVVIPVLALAHHGWAAFDTKVKVTLEGTVTDFHFINPHSVIEFDVKDEKGVMQAWEGELTSPSHLAPRGWTAHSLEAGDKVSITGWPAKNGTHSVWISKVVMADGRELPLNPRDD